MNKKLLTLAVAGAIVGGMGVAQADVTVYGKAHVSLDVMHVDAGGGAYVDDSNVVVANNSSRLGFKFSEDLGGSFFKKAIGQYEASVTIDGEDAETSEFDTVLGDSGEVTTTSGIFGGSVRNSFLGLETAGGTMLAGIHDTPLKIVGRAIELFPEQLGDARNIISKGTTGIGWDLRPANTVVYASPNFAGVGVMLAWVADADPSYTTTDDNELTGFSANVTYKGGPAYVGLAYEKHDSNILAGEEDETAFRLAASGTFGMFKVVGLYQQVSDVNGTAGADRSSYGLGGSVTLAEKHVIKAQYYVADTADNVATDNGASMYAVGYDYKLSKKTTGYVSYAKTSNDTNGTFGVNGGGHGDTLSSTSLQGLDASGVSAGMIMDF